MTRRHALPTFSYFLRPPMFHHPITGCQHRALMAILSFGPPAGGTLATLEYCQKHGKPHLLLDAGIVDTAAAQQITAFVSANAITTLNVAGPRASKQPQIYAYVFGVISQVIRYAS